MCFLIKLACFLLIAARVGYATINQLPEDKEEGSFESKLLILRNNQELPPDFWATATDPEKIDETLRILNALPESQKIRRGRMFGFLGYNYSKSSRYYEAIISLKHALCLLTEAESELKTFYLINKNESSYFLIKDLNKERGVVYSKLGLFSFSLGNYHEACRHLWNALDLLPHDRPSDAANLWSHLGVSYHKLGDHQNAINSMEQALILLPDDSSYAKGKVWGNLGIFHAELGNYPQAIDCLNESLGLFSGPESVHKKEQTRANLKKLYTHLGINYPIQQAQNGILDSLAELRIQQKSP
ncbi:MAG: tetratricopeptide repeat protein [Alphaproteobacteria bacterium]|nr:tetratricopeptide repeat protein [Alphaproteobacteria bacterium]